MPQYTEEHELREFAAEIKFLIPPEGAEAIRRWARARLDRDPHGSGPAGDTYQTTSLYFDTERFDVFHREGSFGRSKYRIRRYGQSGHIFLERKMKTKDMVSKRRSIIPIEQLEQLNGAEPERGWPGYWFHRRMLARELNPVCQISYRRTALVCGGEFGRVRLTLDDDLRTLSTEKLEFRAPAVAMPISSSHTILELKYRHALPEVFRELIDGFSLAPQPVSKYRMAVAALGLVEEPSYRAI